jgi:hypothetical protein
MTQVRMFAILFAQVGTIGEATASLLYSLAVALPTITTLLCPLMVPPSNPAAESIDRHMPEPIRRAILR